MSSGKREKQLFPTQSLGTTFLATGNPEIHKTPVNIDPVSSNPCEIPPKLFKKSQGGGVSGEGPEGASGVLRLSRSSLAEYQDDQSDRIDLRHHSSPNQALQGLSESRRHAAYDIQARDERREELAKTAWVRISGKSDNRSEVQKRNRGVNKKSGGRLISSPYTTLI